MASLIFGDASSDQSTNQPTLTRPKLTRQLTGTSDAPDEDSVMGNTEEMGNQTMSNEMDRGNQVNASNSAQTYQSKITQPINLKFNMGGIKDEGVKGKENQDDYFLWDKGDGKTFVIAVLDGHGRELGKLGSKAAKDSIYNDLTSDNVLNQLRTTPKETMTEVFRRANDAIRTVSCYNTLLKKNHKITVPGVTINHYF